MLRMSTILLTSYAGKPHLLIPEGVWLVGKGTRAGRSLSRRRKDRYSSERRQKYSKYRNQNGEKRKRVLRSSKPRLKPRSFGVKACYHWGQQENYYQRDCCSYPPPS